MAGPDCGLARAARLALPASPNAENDRHGTAISLRSRRAATGTRQGRPMVITPAMPRHGLPARHAAVPSPVRGGGGGLAMARLTSTVRFRPPTDLRTLSRTQGIFCRMSHATGSATDPAVPGARSRSTRPAHWGRHDPAMPAPPLTSVGRAATAPAYFSMLSAMNRGSPARRTSSRSDLRPASRASAIRESRSGMLAIFSCPASVMTSPARMPFS